MEHKHLGFKRLKKMIAEKGARDPGAVAASVMHKKYKEHDIVKHQQSGTSMSHVKPKKQYG
jgi:hypothetical protein